jgi:AraC-like DNA-binding protein
VRSIVEDATFMHEHGETPEAIAQRLKLSPKTVDRYFSHVGKRPPWADQ